MDSNVPKPVFNNIWFAGVDSLRFVCAFIVLMSHLKNPISISLRHSQYAIVQYFSMFFGLAFVGIAAVMAFFVISGFVIHYPNRSGIKDLKSFYIRRFVRILVPLIVIKLIGSQFGHPEDEVVWSLYCELFYYAIYPVLIQIKTSWKTKIIVAYIIALLVIVIGSKTAMLSMIYQKNMGYNGNFVQGTVFLTFFVGLPFWLFGVDLAERIHKLNAKVSEVKIWTYRISVYLVSVLCSVLMFHAYVPYVFSMVVISLPIGRWVELEIQYFKHKKPIAAFEWMGKFSYSMYLCHTLIYAVLLRFLPLNNYTYFVFVIVAVICSYGFYLVLEKPSHYLAKKLSSRKPVVAANL